MPVQMIDISAARAGNHSTKAAHATSKLDISTVVFMWSVTAARFLLCVEDELPVVAEPDDAGHAVHLRGAEGQHPRAGRGNRQLDQTFLRRAVASQVGPRLKRFRNFLWEARQLVSAGARHKKSRQDDGCEERDPGPLHRAVAVLNGDSANAIYR